MRRRQRVKSVKPSDVKLLFDSFFSFLSYFLNSLTTTQGDFVHP